MHTGSTHGSVIFQLYLDPDFCGDPEKTVPHQCDGKNWRMMVSHNAARWSDGEYTSALFALGGARVQMVLEV